MDSLGATNGAVDIVPGLTRTVGRVRIEALLVLIPNVLALKGAEQWVLCNEKIRSYWKPARPSESKCQQRSKLLDSQQQQSEIDIIKRT